MELEGSLFRKEGRVVAWHDDIFNHVPEYDDYMYLRGYTPTEIMYAHRKQTQRQIEEIIRKRGLRDSKKQIQSEAEDQIADFIEETVDELLRILNNK